MGLSNPSRHWNSAFKKNFFLKKGGGAYGKGMGKETLPESIRRRGGVHTCPLVWMILIQHAKTNREYLSVTFYSSVTELFIYLLLYFTSPESNQLQCVIFLNREVTECLQEVLRWSSVQIDYDEQSFSFELNYVMIESTFEPLDTNSFNGQ